MTEQPVTDSTDAVATPTSEGVSELDSLLEEFNEPEPAPKQDASPDVTKSELKEFLAGAKADKEEQFRTESDKGIQESSEIIAKSLDLGLNEGQTLKIARGLLKDAADSNPGMLKAFTARKSNPKAWNKILMSIPKEFGEGRVDDNATGSHDALAQSLAKGGTQSKSSDDDSAALNSKLNKMSDQEFESHIQSLSE